MSRALICLFLFAGLVSAQSRCNLSSGEELSAAQQTQFKELLSRPVDHAAVWFAMALSNARVGNLKQALNNLRDALAATPWLDPATEPDFRALQSCNAFRELVQRVETKYPPISAGKSIFTVAQKDLIPEGLTVDSSTGTFYLSSIYHRKIIKIARDGKVTDFVPEGKDGLLSVLGIHVDPADRSIWAASERAGSAALFHFDVAGNTISSFAPKDPGKHLFNDLVITPAEDVYVTDSENGSIYKLAHGATDLVRIGLGSRLYPNGIAVSDDGRVLYVAHAFGIARIDVGSGAVRELDAPKRISLAQIDGLYYWHGSLIAIQNGFGPNRIVQLQLTPDGDAVSSGKLLEFRSETLELPTTGAIYKGWFYYVVNSQIDHEEDGKLKDPEHLKPVRIARLRLRN
jgi:DNA-binding beta-propeller fold protein YncE